MTLYTVPAKDRDERLSPNGGIPLPIDTEGSIVVEE
jgi:hypothetical protein